MEQNSKKWWASRTVHLAIAQALIMILAAAVTGNPEIGWLGTAKSLVDIYMRFVTKQPVSK